MTILVTFRHSFEYVPLGLSFNQFGFYPHIYHFIFPFSRSLVTY